MISLCGTTVDLNKCHSPNRKNILHAAAKYNLFESAKAVLADGYNDMLLEVDDEQPGMFPLHYAVKEKHWLIIKLYLEALSFR